MSDDSTKTGGNTFNVTSSNQSGGITAGQIVYNERPKRTLHGKQIEPGLVAKLQGRTISPLSIMAWNPDAETPQFARHVWDLATQLGWPVTSMPGNTICPDIFNGISVKSVATASDVGDPLRVLAEWLAKEGFSPTFVHGASANEIVVGPQP